MPSARKKLGAIEPQMSIGMDPHRHISPVVETRQTSSKKGRIADEYKLSGSLGTVKNAHYRIRQMKAVGNDRSREKILGKLCPEIVVQARQKAVASISEMCREACPGRDRIAHLLRRCRRMTDCGYDALFGELFDKGKRSFQFRSERDDPDEAFGSFLPFVEFFDIGWSNPLWIMSAARPFLWRDEGALDMNSGDRVPYQGIGGTSPGNDGAVFGNSSPRAGNDGRKVADCARKGERTNYPLDLCFSEAWR